MADTKLVCAFLLVLFAFCIQDTEAGDWCYYHYGSYSGSYSSKYCTYGCCGSKPRQYCCTTEFNFSWTPIIVMCVIAGIILLGFVVALVCCCIKKQSHAGRVVHPAELGPRPAAGVTVVHAGTSYPGPGVPMGPVLPPPYKQFNNTPPPAYTYSDPAYPPGAAAYPPPASAAFHPPPSAPAYTQSPPPGYNGNGPN